MTRILPSIPVSGDMVLAKQLSGKIILEVERNGEAWYINPVNLRKYYLGRPDDAFLIMRQLGLGISVRDLTYIPKAFHTTALNTYSSHDRKTVTTFSGTFTVDIITIDLSNPKLKIKTLAAADGNCVAHCPAKSVAEYYERGKGFLPFPFILRSCQLTWSSCFEISSSRATTAVLTFSVCLMRTSSATTRSAASSHR
jgi:hypothetical protein